MDENSWRGVRLCSHVLVMRRSARFTSRLGAVDNHVTSLMLQPRYGRRREPNEPSFVVLSRSVQAIYSWLSIVDWKFKSEDDP